MNADQRAAARARCEAATEGEWRHCSGMVRPTGSPFEAPIERHSVAAFTGDAEIGHKVAIAGETDAEFIAHARTDLPAALAALESVEQERDALKAAAVEIIRWHRASCGCVGATCGYGERIANLRALVSVEEGTGHE